MARRTRSFGIAFILALLAALPASSSRAATAEELHRDAQAALQQLYDSTPAAKVLGEKAKAILIFPEIVNASFIVGGEYGQGELLKNGTSAGYYNLVAGSYGLQAGASGFSYAMFLMTDKAVKYLNESAGWEIGSGPLGVVVVDEGMAKELTSTSVRSDVYSFVFGSKGLMAGIQLQGSKISKIEKK